MPIATAMNNKDYKICRLYHEADSLRNFFGIDIDKFDVVKIGFRTFMLLDLKNKKPQLLIKINNNDSMNIEYLWEQEKDTDIEDMKRLISSNIQKIFKDCTIDITGYTISKIGNKHFLMEKYEESNLLLSILHINGSVSISCRFLDLGEEINLELIPPKKIKIQKEHKNKYKN